MIIITKKEQKNEMKTKNSFDIFYNLNKFFYSVHNHFFTVISNKKYGGCSI
jgi:hypothetical protein